MKITETQKYFVEMWNAASSILAYKKKKGGIDFLLNIAEIKAALKPEIDKLQLVQGAFQEDLMKRSFELNKEAKKLAKKDDKGEAVTTENGFIIPLENKDQLDVITKELDDKYKEALSLSVEYEKAIEKNMFTVELPEIPRASLPEKLYGPDVEALFKLIAKDKSSPKKE